MSTSYYSINEATSTYASQVCLTVLHLCCLICGLIAMCGISGQTTLWTFTMARTSHHWHMRINALPSNKTWLCNMPPLSPTHGARHLYTVFWSTRDEDREYRYEYRQLRFAMALDPLLPRAPSPPPHDATREPEGTRMGLGDEHGNEDHKVASHHWHILLSVCFSIHVINFLFLHLTLTVLSGLMPRRGNPHPSRRFLQMPPRPIPWPFGTFGTLRRRNEYTCAQGSSVVSLSCGTYMEKWEIAIPNGYASME